MCLVSAAQTTVQCGKLPRTESMSPSTVPLQLAAMRASDPAAKALIVTQFSSTLSWLGVRLQREGYGHRTISGSMPLKKRAQGTEARCRPIGMLHTPGCCVEFKM